MRDGPGHDGRAVFSAWQWLWWSSSALALIAALAVFYCVPEDPRQRVAGRLFDGVRRAWSSATVLLASTFALYSLMFFALFAFLPVLLMERMDVTYRDAGLLSALASAVNISGNLAAGWLLARDRARCADPLCQRDHGRSRARNLPRTVPATDDLPAVPAFSPLAA